MRLVARRTENGREIGAVESMKKGQLADLPVYGVQPGKRGAYESAVFRLLGGGDWRGNSGKCCGIIRCRGRLVQLHRRNGIPEPQVALVARHCEQPRPQPARLSQLGDFG